MKKNLSIRAAVVLCFFLACLIGAVCVPVKAAQDTESPEPAKKPVRVAVVDYPNYLMMGRDRTVSGYAYEYMMEIAKYTDWDYEFIEMTFSDALDAICKGEIDLLAGNQYTQERAGLMDYSKQDMGEAGTVLCVKRSNDRYSYNDFENFGGIRIAALKRTVRIGQTKEKLAEYGVTANFIEYETDEECRAALNAGEVDAALMSSIRCESDCKLLARINTAKSYFCTNRERPELKAELDEAMEQIHLISPYYEAKLTDKYYGDILMQISLTREEREFIENCGTLTVALSWDMPPVEYYDEEADTYRGITVDVLEKIAAFTGLKFEYVRRKGLEEMLREMEEGNIHMIGSLSADPFVAEQMHVQVTDPVYTNSISIVTKSEDYLSMPGKVAIKPGYPVFKKTANQLGFQDIVHYDSFEDCIEAVNKGDAQLTLVSTYSIGSYLHHPYYNSLKTYVLQDTSGDYGIGVYQSENTEKNELLYSILNKAILSISESEMNQIHMMNLINVSSRTNFRDFWYTNKIWFYGIMLFIAGLMFVMVIINWRRMQKANRMLVAADRTKSDFFARMSHDIRTPLNGIIGITELALGGDQTDYQSELQKIRTSAYFLKKLVNDILDMSKLENKKMDLHPQPYNSQDLEDYLNAVIFPLCEEKKIHFVHKTYNFAGYTVLCDPLRINQVLFNLLSNAVKFTPPGGTVAVCAYNLSVEEGMLLIDFVVSDDGIGMSREFQEHLFEPYAREYSKFGQNIPGTGLGLSIAKQIVELMGGTLSVRSELGAGTEFTLELFFPIVKGPEEEVKEDKFTGARLKGKRILVCEDHPLNREIVERLLLKCDMLVEMAEDGLIGLEKFCKSERGYFDVLLMDIRMPILDGIEAVKAIRTLDRSDAKSVPIVAMTANGFDEDMQLCLNNGFDAYLTKPVGASRLYRTLEEFFL